MHSEGGRPDFQRFQRLADVAGVNASWLAYGVERVVVIDDVRTPPDQASDANAHTDAPRNDPEADRLVELSSLPNWPALLEAAKARARDKNRNLPDWVWDAVASATLRIVGTPEPIGVYELAVVHFENGWGRPRDGAAVPSAMKG